MRLHHLEIEAFGPFAAPAHVDFDELSSAGLFLLSGATGAGKSSVLDAVCFALYGDVPGDRSTAKQLASDLADPTVRPRVTLEATLSGRRFRIVRSPSWERAKRRGVGTTTEPASVTISERVADGWRPLSSRLDETGDLVTRLVGMNLPQFTQVAMLPQGRFQAFLRARSEERHTVLQQLFRTGRFEQVERWLRERRLRLGRDHDAAHQRAADLVSRVSEAADVALPADWDVHDLSPVVDDDVLRSWAAGLLDEAVIARADGDAQAELAAAEEVTARARLDEARAQRDLRVRYDAARAELDTLEATAARHADDVRRLDGATRASAVLPLHRHAVAAVGAAAERRRTADVARHAAAARLGADADVTTAALAEAAGAAARAAGVVRAVQPRAARLERAVTDLTALGARRARLVDELAAARVEHAELPARVERLRADVADAREAVVRLEHLEGTVQAVRARLEAHRQAARLGLETADARHEWLDTREQTLVLRERLIALQHARIEGMAAELAGQLAAGCSCPVCGSAEHPVPAAASPGSPDAGAERAARVDVDNAAMVELAFDTKVRDLETSLAAALARAGDTTPEALASELVALDEKLATTGAVAARLPALLSRLAGAEQHLADVARRLGELATDGAGADAEHAALGDEVAGLRGEVEALLAGSGHRDLDSLLRHHASLERLCRDALAADGAATGAEQARHDAVAAARAAAADAGFATADTAAAAALDPRAHRALADAVAAHERRLAVVRAVLAEPSASEVLATPAPDLAVLDAAHRAARAACEAAVSEQRLWTAREQRLTGLVADLERVLATWLPLRAELALATRLSSFVEGKAADNALRMRLSAYVLAYRLSQVVAAANERLAGMSDQRYSLEHTGRRGAGETRGGLSLLVRDDWSGEARDPATLSGGETFVVSLALALGLADVITQETGGAALDTLFVDEGFGSLDADTLDDVMDTLDALRDGGRVVGLVSHVAEMRDRIPTQLVVTKSRTGSSLAVRR